MDSNQPKFSEKQSAEVTTGCEYPSSHIRAEQIANYITSIGSNNLAAGRDIIQHHNQHHHHPPQTEPVTSVRLIDRPVRHFTGRKELIKQIHDLMKECATKSDYTERIVVLRGIGGMGKSETARKYVEMHINDPIITNVIWIDAETEDSTRSSFRNLAYNLNRDPKDMKTEYIAQEFYRHFSQYIKTGLIIFDNVEQLRDRNPYHGILNYLPNQYLDHVPLILITSRINDWEIPVESEYIIEISGLEEDAAVDYLYKSIKMKRNITTTKAFSLLAKAIDGYPLGLTLAASTITSYGMEDITCGIDNYIKRLDVSKQDWIQDTFTLGAATNYKLLMKAVWDATIEKIKTVEKHWWYAIELLSIMAYFPTDQIYKDSIFKFYKSILERTESNFEVGMRILKTYSLASVVPGDLNNSIRIHRHVQLCSRTMLEFENDFSYLGLVASYGKAEELSSNAKSLKKSLEQWPWSRESLKEFILIFARVLNEDIAWEMKLCLDKVHDISAYKTEYWITVYYLSLYYLCKSRPDTDGLKVVDVNEERSFLVGAKAFLDVDDVSLKNTDVNAKSIISNLWGKLFPYENLMPRLKGQLKSQFRDILFAFAQNPVKRQYDQYLVSQIFEYFKLFYLDEACDDPEKYLAAALRYRIKYQQNYDSVFPFRGISKYFNVEDSKWKIEYQAVVDTFFREGGTKIIMDILKAGCYGFGSIEVITLLIQMTLYPGCSQRLVQEEDFMNRINNCTTFSFAKPITRIYYYHYLDLLLWLGLFSSKRTIQDPNGKEWGIASVADCMKIFADQYKNDEQGGTFIIKKCYLKELKPLQSILKMYLSSPPGLHDDLTLETVNIMYTFSRNLLKYDDTIALAVLVLHAIE